jgi:hypothetical protein
MAATKTKKSVTIKRIAGKKEVTWTSPVDTVRVVATRTPILKRDAKIVRGGYNLRPRAPRATKTLLKPMKTPAQGGNLNMKRMGWNVKNDAISGPE